jgi:quercetin dioxygenase-like cupin family protein
MTQEEWMKALAAEGFSDLSVVSFAPGFVAGEHTHDQHTVHVILSGDLIITDGDESKTYRPGDRVEFPVGTTHHARGGAQAWSMIVGTKIA